jgi:hypothetical protein
MQLNSQGKGGFGYRMEDWLCMSVICSWSGTSILLLYLLKFETKPVYFGLLYWIVKAKAEPVMRGKLLNTAERSRTGP